MNREFARRQDRLRRRLGPPLCAQHHVAPRVELQVKEEVVPPGQARGQEIVPLVAAPHPDFHPVPRAVLLGPQPGREIGLRVLLHRGRGRNPLVCGREASQQPTDRGRGGQPPERFGIGGIQPGDPVEIAQAGVQPLLLRAELLELEPDHPGAPGLLLVAREVAFQVLGRGKLRVERDLDGLPRRIVGRRDRGLPGPDRVQHPFEQLSEAAVTLRLHGPAQVVLEVCVLPPEKRLLLPDRLFDPARRDFHLVRPLPPPVIFGDGVEEPVVGHRRPPVLPRRSQEAPGLHPGDPRFQFGPGVLGRTQGVEEDARFVEQVQVAPGAQDGKQQPEHTGAGLKAEADLTVRARGLHPFEGAPGQVRPRVFPEGADGGLRTGRVGARDPGVLRAAAEEQTGALASLFEDQDERKGAGLDDAPQPGPRPCPMGDARRAAQFLETQHRASPPPAGKKIPPERRAPGGW